MKETCHSFSPAERGRLRKSLLRWYQANSRELPWRQHRDPYPIWVSEIMLQQTQVATVIPYFHRFLSLFPSIKKLAQADEQAVLRAWEGLGYYRRARHLHQAARHIVQHHEGRFPVDVKDVEALPGFGRYTIGAVLSQAFGHPLPIVEANVTRVFTRLLAWTNELESKATQNWLWQTAETLLPSKGAGNFNQAIMELGQTICKTGSPDCLLCPLREMCRGHQLGLADSLPRKRSKQRATQIQEVAILLMKKGHVLLGQRKSDSPRWANMWEFPVFTTDTYPLAQLAIVKQLYAITGCNTGNLTRLGDIHYGITRFQVTLHVYQGTFKSGRSQLSHYHRLTWVKPQTLSEHPLSIPHRRIAQQWLAV